MLKCAQVLLFYYNNLRKSTQQRFEIISWNANSNKLIRINCIHTCTGELLLYKIVRVITFLLCILILKISITLVYSFPLKK